MTNRVIGYGLVLLGGSLNFLKTIIGSRFLILWNQATMGSTQFFEGKFQNQRIVNSNSGFFIKEIALKFHFSRS